MSNVSNRHSVVAFVAGESKALSEQRLSKVGYKSSKTNPAKFPSVCASVPKIAASEIEGHFSQLIPHVRTMLESAQDGIFKSLYESNKGNLDVITDDDISMNAIIAYLEAESTGGRLTKDLVYSWFDRAAKDATQALIQVKLGFPEDLNEDQLEVVNKHIHAYRETFASLSGGKTMLNQKQCNGLKAVIELIETEEEIGTKLSARIKGIEEEINKVSSLADLIG
jgi:hypothetical protein